MNNKYHLAVDSKEGMKKQTVASANEAQGQFFSIEGVIGYVTTEKGVSHANTILHEIMHAIIYQWNIDLHHIGFSNIGNTSPP